MLILRTQKERVEHETPRRGGQNKGFKNKAHRGRHDNGENREDGSPAHTRTVEREGSQNDRKNRKMEKACMGGYRKVIGTECEISVRKRRSR
jgi:hypothetical protein